MNMKVWTILLAVVASSGCVVSTPIPEPQCPRYSDTALVLEVPPPIPESVFISIAPGQQAKANDGGKTLLRGYVDLRERIQQWHESR